eukprot:3150035-Amphidinium_carterae.1
MASILDARCGHHGCALSSKCGTRPIVCCLCVKAELPFDHMPGFCIDAQCAWGGTVRGDLWRSTSNSATD